jgi:hypothetical protein
MKFLLRTRCGCVREIEGFVPPPLEISLPLKQPPQVLKESAPQDTFPEIRKFKMYGSYFPGDDNYGYVYEEVK